MNNIVDKTVKRMQELMNSSNTISESKKNATDPVEYASKGPDGNYYGIVREGSNFYIKMAKTGNKKPLKEDFDYIGGFVNRNKNSFSSYAAAVRKFEGKMASLKEAYEANCTIIEGADKSHNKTAIIEAKRGTEGDVKRQLEIMNKSVEIDEGYHKAKTISEAKEITKKNKAKAAPFSIADTDSEAFDKDGKPKRKGTHSSFKPFSKGCCKGSIVANIKEAAKDNEDWGDVDNDDDDDEDINLDKDYNDEDDLTGDMEDTDDADNDFDTDEFDDDTETFHVSPDAKKIEIILDDSDEDQFDDDDLYDDDNEEGDDESEEGDEDEEPVKKESFRRRGRAINEEQFWGKHPAYRRQPFTLPARKRGYKNTRQWDDSSVENETPYGSDNQEYKAPFSVRPNGRKFFNESRFSNKKKRY